MCEPNYNKRIKPNECLELYDSLILRVFLASLICLSISSKLKAFSEKIDVDLIKNYLHAWELVCKGGKEGGPIGQQEMAVRFRWLSAPRSTIIQSSSIHPGICTDPQTVLEDLFQLYVL